MRYAAFLLLLMTGMAWPQDLGAPSVPSDGWHLCRFANGVITCPDTAPVLKIELPDQIPYQCCQFPDISTDYWEHIECNRGACTITPEIYFPPRIEIPEPKELKRKFGLRFLIPPFKGEIRPTETQHIY